jgi:hypothetical protein
MNTTIDKKDGRGMPFGRRRVCLGCLMCSTIRQSCGSASLLHTAGTTREQFGNRYASTVWRFWHIIDVIDCIFPFFPYLLINRTEEAAGSNPARSTKIHAFSREWRRMTRFFIILSLLRKVDGQMSRVNRDKCPVHL